MYFTCACVLYLFSLLILVSSRFIELSIFSLNASIHIQYVYIYICSYSYILCACVYLLVLHLFEVLATCDAAVAVLWAYCEKLIRIWTQQSVHKLSTLIDVIIMTIRSCEKTTYIAVRILRCVHNLHILGERLKLQHHQKLCDG